MTRVESPAPRLCRWLLTRPQLAGGVHAGAVCEPGGRHTGLGLTGDYLTWLSAMRCRPAAGPPPAVAAGRAISWLRSQLDAAGPPRTRGHLDPALDGGDWRNDATFTLDLALALRGVSAWHDTHPGAEAVRRRCVALLTELCDEDGGFTAARPLAGHGPLPPRWSTRPGPHLLKVAGAVLAWSGPIGAPALARAARITLVRYGPGLAHRLPASAHAALYAMEGLLLADYAGAGDHTGDLLAAYLTLDASFPTTLPREYLGEPASRLRNDVLAQTLRIGAALAGRGLLDPGRADRLPTLAAHLTHALIPAGGVPFSATDQSAGTYCGLVAHQALSWYEEAAAGRGVPADWVRRLV